MIVLKETRLSEKEQQREQVLRRQYLREEIPCKPQNTMRGGQNKNTMMLATGNTVQCRLNRKGFCSTHEVKAKKSLRDRGGGEGLAMLL